MLRKQHSSLVIDTLSKGVDGDGVIVTYVYCDFSTRNMQSASTVLGSVLRQVIGALAKVPDEVRGSFEHARRQTDGCRPLLCEILEMLIEYIRPLERVFICIDALDESPAKDRSELLEYLQRIVGECPNTRLFLTGRLNIGDAVRRCFPKSAELPISPREDDV